MRLFASKGRLSARYRAFRDDERGVSISVSHALSITITAILVAGLVVAASGGLNQQRERAADAQLSTIGQRLAFEVEEVGTLAVTGESDGVSLTTDHTSDVVGGSYRVGLSDDPSVCSSSAACLWLSTTSPNVDVTVDVNLPADVSIQPSSAAGGAVRIVYDGTLRLEAGG